MASLHDSITSIELGVLEGDRQDLSLESSMLCAVFLVSGKGKIGREMFEVSLEEILDLIFHVGKFLSRDEEEFEWSSIDGTVQDLKVFRESINIRTEISIALQGTTGISMQFDTNEKCLGQFGEELKLDLRKALDLKEDQLKELQDKLREKITSIRKEGRSPYSKQG